MPSCFPGDRGHDFWKLARSTNDCNDTLGRPISKNRRPDRALRSVRYLPSFASFAWMEGLGGNFALRRRGASR